MPVLLLDAYSDARSFTAAPCRHHRLDRNVLLHKANGLGYRRIAATIGRPVSTVRRWLRRLPPAHLQRLARDGTREQLALDPDTFTAVCYHGNMLHHGLSLSSAAAFWERRRYAVGDPPWSLIGMYTRGRLLALPG